MTYEEKLGRINCLENTYLTAVNQTEVYNIISRHFDSPLSAGKTAKKAIVIGYDGCTAEMLNFLGDIERGAIKYLLSNGGKGVFSYAGGRPYPEEITQETSTAPGWCSMLTGALAEENTVDDNGITKPLEPKSLFISLIEEGKAEKTAFYVSWEGHFIEDNSTYLEEKRYIKENALPAVFDCAKDDDGTLANIFADLEKKDCSDFIFGILEYPDHFGHSFDFRSEVKEYMGAFISSEKAGMDIIDAIKNREDYAKEDWLVLVTSDHGGFESGHGGPTLPERITFIITNK